MIVKLFLFSFPRDVFVLMEIWNIFNGKAEEKWKVEEKNVMQA